MSISPPPTWQLSLDHSDLSRTAHLFRRARYKHSECCSAMSQKCALSAHAHTTHKAVAYTEFLHRGCIACSGVDKILYWGREVRSKPNSRSQRHRGRKGVSLPQPTRVRGFGGSIVSSPSRVQGKALAENSFGAFPA